MLYQKGDEVVFRKDRGFSDETIYTVRYEYLDGLLMQQFLKFEEGGVAAAVNVELLKEIL